ncbi:MAG: LLM class flavin-dependent oxidoreductase [Deltaproteobacteria bacterium]|nr:LLM class flavin-dependent oxidoreductase [Deltaproteobacteria bacterium]
MQKPTPPIWIGGDSKRSMELAAELGDGWLVHSHQPHEIDRMFQSIRSTLGDKAEGFGLGTAAFVIMGSDPIKHELNNRVSGNPQQCLDRIKEYEQVGMTRFILIFLDQEDAEWFAQDVLPKLR